MEYGSRNVANTALGLSIGSTALGLMNGAGGLMNLFGGGPRPPADPGDRPVSRYEMGLIKENTEKDIIIAKLEGQQYTDGVAAGLQSQISKQLVVNASQIGVNNMLEQHINQLMSMTKTFIPVANIALPANSGDVATSASTTGGT